MKKIERERLMKQMDEMAKTLGIPPLPRLHLGFLVEKNGRILHEHDEIGHSWTRNAWNFLFGVMTSCSGSGSSGFGAGYMTGKQSSGTIDYYEIKGSGVEDGTGCRATAAGDGKMGIVLGTDDTVFDADQTTLAGPILNGETPGTMSYNPMTWPTLSYDAGTYTWTADHQRIYNNNSGDSIIVKEVGLIFRACVFGNYLTRYYLFARDVLASPVTVVNGAQLTVTYSISMNFSAIDAA